MHSRHWLVLFALIGCKGNEVDEDTDDTDAADTDVEDTDVEDSDTDTGPFDGFEADVRLDGTGGDWRVAAYICELGGPDGGLVPVREVASAAWNGSPTKLGVPTPDASDVSALFTDATGVFYAIYAYEDADGDGVQGEGELVDAMASQFLLYITDAGSTGLAEGWEGLAFLPGQETPLPYVPADGFDLVDLRPALDLTIGGTVDAAVPETATRFAAISYLEEMATLPGRPVDQALTDPFTADISGVIDPSRTEVQDSRLEIGVEYLVAYQDADGSGDVSVGDATEGYACWDNSVAFLYWISPVADVGQAFPLVVLDLRTGWQVMRFGEPEAPPERLGEVEAQALVVMPDFSCGAP
jgi:hypothetical protein